MNYNCNVEKRSNKCLVKNLSRECGIQLTLYLKYLATRFDIKAIELNVIVSNFTACRMYSWVLHAS